MKIQAVGGVGAFQPTGSVTCRTRSGFEAVALAERLATEGDEGRDARDRIAHLFDLKSVHQAIGHGAAKLKGEP